LKFNEFLLTNIYQERKQTMKHLKQHARVCRYMTAMWSTTSAPVDF